MSKFVPWEKPEKEKEKSVTDIGILLIMVIVYGGGHLLAYLLLGW